MYHPTLSYANGGVVMTEERESYVQIMMKKMYELQRKPTFNEVKEDQRMPHPNGYAFYWRSFDEAVEVIWAKTDLHKKELLTVHMARKGGVVMAKAKPKVWPHTTEELLELAVQRCNERGKMLNRRCLTHDNFLNFEEVVAVLGKGDWNRAVLKIQFAWDQQKKQQAEAKAEAKKPAVQEPVPSEVAVQETVAEVRPSTKKSRKGMRYTLDDLRAAMSSIQAHFQITGMPTQNQINQAAREIGTPTYVTFAKAFGPKSEWATKLE